VGPRTTVTIRAAEFDRVITKFGFSTREGRDRLAWLEVDGRKIIYTKRSRQRAGDLPRPHEIRQQLKLDEAQLAQAIRCTLDRDGYLAILRAKGLIPAG
jgi:hypothetical protein